MKQVLEVSGNQLNFSNSGEGFKINIYSPENENPPVYLNLLPWGVLPDFVSVVTDYSWANGLCEVSYEKLVLMRNSFSDAIRHVQEEIDHKRKI